MSLRTKLPIRLFTLSLLAAVFGFTSLQAQTVAYVANSSSNSVSVINTATNTVTTTIPVGSSPVGVVFSPDSTRAYVANSGDGTVSVINTGNNTVMTTIAVTSGPNPSSPFKLAITPDGKSLYVTDLGNAAVTVINTADNTVSATIPINNLGSDVVILPKATSAYVADITGFVSVINIANNTVVPPLLNLSVPGPATIFLSVTPDSGHIYAGSGGGSTVEVIDTTTNAVTTLPTSVPGAGDVLVTQGGDTVYVADIAGTNNKVSVIDAANNSVQPDLITVGSGPQFMAATPDGSFVYVTNFNDNTVSIIATTGNTVGPPITVGTNPEGIAIANLSTALAAFTVEDLDIGEHRVSLDGDLTLGATSGGLDLAHQPVSLTVGTLSFTIPAGSFKQVGGQHHFVCHTSNLFRGTIAGLRVDFDLKAERGSSTAFDYSVTISRVDLDVPNPVTVTLQIGENSGTVSTCQNCDGDDD
ncbi:MAG TPA: YncE family protein [Candidatus Angelobacter sp.]|nr:YncE family protein [Candidatus Angelobacter sp.]